MPRSYVQVGAPRQVPLRLALAVRGGLPVRRIAQRHIDIATVKIGDQACREVRWTALLAR